MDILMELAKGIALLFMLGVVGCALFIVYIIIEEIKKRPRS